MNIEDSLDEAYELVGFQYLDIEEKYERIEVGLNEIDKKLNQIKKVVKEKIIYTNNKWRLNSFLK